ncbi:hypothetical protein KSB_10560 [Ktedonobacter robiniae]|uniref:Recombinase domain-containing protein n=1 Tax=Ktedonobacter robiniae TaxID=2778365 RepID=A0ABQ3UIN1_9CHLR|nr:hypothetical protein KSB_10560 [Ktedonobacter robiniae]
MLTNPIYIGYQSVNGVIRRDRQGNMITSHEAIIDLELFFFAYYRLSKYDLDGTLLEGREVKRYFYRGDQATYGLCKYRIRWSDGPVRTEAHGEYDGDTPVDRPIYILAPETFKLGSKNYMCLPCEEVDAEIVNRLMYHVQELSKEQKETSEYEKQAQVIREGRKKKIKQIEQSFVDIEVKQTKLANALSTVKDDNSSKVDPKQVSTRLQELIIEQMRNLERERLLLMKDKQRLEEEAENDIGSLEEELQDLEALWPKYRFSKRQSLINFVVREVVIDIMSTHWVRIQVTWLHEGWGTEELYYARQRGKQGNWTPEEEAILKENWATTTKAQLMTLLPDRAWRSIQMRGHLAGIKRKTGPRSLEEKTLIVGNGDMVGL